MSLTGPMLFFASEVAPVTLVACNDLIGFFRRVRSYCYYCSLNVQEWELVSILAC